MYILTALQLEGKNLPQQLEAPWGRTVVAQSVLHIYSGFCWGDLLPGPEGVVVGEQSGLGGCSRGRGTGLEWVTEASAGVSRRREMLCDPSQKQLGKSF